MHLLLTFLRRLLGLSAALLAAAATPAAAQTVYALTQDLAGNSGLTTFQATTPGTPTAAVPLTGLLGQQSLVGIDVRPATGQLFGLGYDDALSLATNNAQLYTLAPTGVLTPVGGPLSLDLGNDANRVGFDFNPTVDRIRVTGGNGANLRLNPVTGAVAATDTNLAYAPTDPNAGQMPGVGSSAYTNSYIGSTATVLYDVDEAASRLVTQVPPNNGALNTVGPLGVNVTAQPTTPAISDLDIYFNPATGQNAAYLSVSTASFAGASITLTSRFYTVNLATGAATLVGNFGPQPTTVAVIDIAFAISRPATLPAVTGQLAYALAGTNLLTFDTASPGLIRISTGITGLNATQTLVGLDIRPATNTLYALGYNATAQTYTLYSLNSLTGVATSVNTTPIALALGTGKVGFDFNPTVDRIRVTSGNRANFRLSPIDGTVAATDTPLAYATADANAAATPNIGAVAYTNSVAGPAATATVLYNYDLSLNILTTQSPPNNGTLNTVGATGITANATTPNLDLDIYSSVAGTNTAYLAANTGTIANTSLYTVNLTTGAATLVGAIGNGLAARDIAVAGAAGVTTAVRDRADLAAGVSLYPNPTNGRATLAFSLTRAARAEMNVFDAVGRRVATVTSGVLPAGPQELRWEAGTAKAGLYLVRLVVDGQPAATRQVVVE